MLRKTIVALFAIASIGMLAPDVASARGGFGGGGMGGFRGGGGFGGFRGGGIGMGGAGFRAAAISPGFRTAAFSPGIRSGAFANSAFRGGHFRSGFRHHRGFPFAAAAIGAGLAYGAYGYYDDDYYYGGYPYDDGYYYGAGYYGDGGCYVVQQRVPTPYGWVLQPVQVCN
jgi:hypothetical protein